MHSFQAAPVSDIGKANGSKQQSDFLLPSEGEGLPIGDNVDDISSPPKIAKKEKTNVEKSQRKRRIATVSLQGAFLLSLRLAYSLIIVLQAVDSNSNLESGIMNVPLLKESKHVLTNTLASTTSSKSKILESSIGSKGDSTKDAMIFKKPEMGTFFSF